MQTGLRRAGAFRNLTWVHSPFRYFNSAPEALRLARLRSENDAFNTGCFRNDAGTSGEVLEVFATKRRDRRAVLKFLERMMKRYGRPGTIVTDRRRSYGAVMAEWRQAVA